MSALAHLRTLARGIRPANDGLLGNARCAWGASELLSEEAILAAFAARPFDIEGELLAVETPQGSALIGEGSALVADLYGGRIGRLWRVGGDLAQPTEPAIDVAFDPDMRQERGDLIFRYEDHPDLNPAAAGSLSTAARSLVERVGADGKLRVRGFVVRAFSDPQASAALLSLYTLDNESSRSASFSYAVIGATSGSDDVCAVSERLEAREWTPRF